MMRPLDGPSVQGTISVTTLSVVELKVGASPLKSRKAVTFQAPAKIYIYFGDDQASAPSTTTVIADGIEILKDQIVSFEASDKQPIYALALSGTVGLKVVERA